MEKEDNIIIHFAQKKDANRIVAFLNDNFIDNIYKTSEELLDEFYVSGNFNYVIAEDTITSKIYGVCGYYPYSKELKLDIGAGSWKVIKSTRFLLGVEILKFVQEETGCRMLACCGVNPKTRGHRKLMGHFNGKLKQFYRLNNSLESFSIAKIEKRKILIETNEKQFAFVLIENIESLKEIFNLTKYKEILPYKDYDYLDYRYYHHEKYNYQVIGISDDEVIDAIVIGKVVEINDAKIFQVVDFIGDQGKLSGTYKAWEELMDANKFEYIDFYEYGLDEKCLISAGFVENIEEDGNVIPSLFEPYTQNNMDMYISTNIKSEFRMFRADARCDIGCTL